MKSFLSSSKVKALSAVLVVVMLAQLLSNGVGVVADAETTSTTDGLTISNFEFQVQNSEGEWVTPDADTTVTNGQLAKVTFDWAIANGTGASKFSVDFTQYAKNFAIIDVGSVDEQWNLLDSNGTKVGTFYVTNGIFYIELLDEFTSKSNISGTDAYFEGEIAASGTDDDGKAEIGFGDATYTVPVDLNIPKSHVTFWKGSGNTTYADDGVIYQEYVITLQGSGTSTNVVVSDTPGSMLGTPGSITIDGEAYSGAFPITIEQIEDGQTIEIRYVCAVDSSVMSQSANLWGDTYRNKASITYTNNKDENISSNEYSANVTVNRPYIGKSGTLVTETTGTGEEAIVDMYVDWTITINVGDLSFDVMSNLSDVIGDYQTLCDGYSMPTLDAFTEISEGVYQYTYRTQVSQEAVESEGSVALNNTVSLDYTYDNETYSMSATGTVHTPAKSGVTKEVVSFDLATGIFTWKASVIIPEDGYQSLSLKDTFYVVDEHLYVPNTMKISVTDGETSTELVEGVYTYNENTYQYEYVPANYDYSLGIQQNDLGVWLLDVVFNSSKLADWSGKTIELTYQSKYAETPLYNAKVGTVTNRLQESFTDANGNPGSNSVDATYKMLGNKTTYSYRQSAWPTVVGEDALTWKINLALSEHPELVAGDTIVIKDTLPENMVLDESSVLMDTAYWNPYYFGEDAVLDASIMGALSHSYDKSTNEVTFTVTLTQEILDLVAQIYAQYGSNENSAGLYIGYVTVIDDHAAFVAQDGDVSYTNDCEIYVGETLVCETSATQTLTPSDVLTKAGEAYTGGKTLDYTLSVNPNAYTLSNNGRIKVTDVSGSALLVDITTIVVKDKLGNVLADELWSVDFDPDTRTLTFDLPDATALTITYTAYVNLAYGESMTAENATNSASIEGFSSDVTKDSVEYEHLVVRANVTADAECATIQLFKYATVGDVFTALDGASFLLTPVDYDTTTGTYSSAVTEDKPEISFTVNSLTNGVMSVTNILFDQVYAMTETAAPDGYQKSTEVYYFYVPSEKEGSSTEVACSEDTNVYYTGVIYYENEEAPEVTPTPTPVTYTAHYVYLGTDGQYHEIANETYTAPTASSGDGYTTGTKITVLGSEAFDSTDAVQKPYTESGYTLTWLVYEDGVDITEATEGDALLDMSTYAAMTSKDSTGAGSEYTFGSSNVYFVAQLTTDVTVKVDVTFVDGGNTSMRPNSLDVTLNDTDGETTLTTTTDSLTVTTVDGYTAAQSAAGTLLDGTYPVLDTDGSVIDYSELGVGYTIPSGYAEYKDVYTTEEDGVVTYHIVLKRTYNTTYYVAGSEVTYGDDVPGAAELAETEMTLPDLTEQNISDLGNPEDKYKIVWKDAETGELYEQGVDYTIPARDVTLVAMVVTNTDTEVRPRFAYNFVSYMGSYELPGTMLAKRLAMDYTNGEDLTELITYINCDADSVAADATGKYYYLTIMTGCPKDIDGIILNVGLTGFDAQAEHVFNFTGTDSVTTFKAYKTAKEHLYTDLLAGDEYLDTYQGMVLHKFVIPVGSIDTLYLTAYYDYNKPEMFWGQYEFVIADKVAIVK